MLLMTDHPAVVAARHPLLTVAFVERRNDRGSIETHTAPHGGEGLRAKRRRARPPEGALDVLLEWRVVPRRVQLPRELVVGEPEVDRIALGTLGQGGRRAFQVEGEVQV